jgi:hypothetical protein
METMRGILEFDEPEYVNKPMAAEGLISYRCKGRYGWIMIGATDTNDALNEAARSTDKVQKETLQIWSKEEGKYINVF